MKRLIYTLLCATIGLLPTQAKNMIFEKFANEKNVTYVNVSKSLLSMMDGQLELDALDLESVIDELDRIQILTCEDDAKLIERIRREAVAVFQKSPYEELMRVKDDDETVVFYSLPQSDGKIKELIMVVYENGGELVLIQLSGNISISKLKNLTDNI